MRFFVLIVFTVFFSISYSQKLSDYEMYANHFDIDRYTKQYNRGFDSLGIITQKNEYHALTISVYGIMAADEFIRTKDSIFYYKTIDQYKYFQDTSKLMYFDEGQSVGLPYRFNFNGLKAPWYSGMTQGMAASYLLRYYELTKDQSALILARKIVRFMIKDEKDGGTIGRTSEGYKWIEEYPNCKQSKSVLNGFINGLIGLYEYSLFFPEDTLAKQIHDECYDAMFATLEAYDLPNWTTYNRNRKSIRNSYIRYQLQEFDHMYHLYNDERFRYQMKLWSKFAHGKFDKELKFYKTPRYEFGIRLKRQGTEFVFADEKNFRNSLETCSDIIHKKRRKVKAYNLFYNDVHYCEFTANELRSKQITVRVSNNGTEVSPSFEYKGDTIVVISEKPFDKIELGYKKKVKVAENKLTSLVYNYQKQKVPLFGFLEMTTKPKLEEGKKYKLNLTGDYLCNPRVFYRVSTESKSLQSVKYAIERSFGVEEFEFTAPTTGTYEFFVSYDIKTPVSKIESFSIKSIN